MHKQAPPSEEGPQALSHTNHLLSLAEVDVFLAPSASPGVLDVHEADEGHGAAAQQQDGEEHDDDGGGANELTLLHGLQAQVQAQCIGDGPSKTWGWQMGTQGHTGRRRGEREGSGSRVASAQHH